MWTLSSRQFLSYLLKFFSEHPLMGSILLKFENHLICISKMAAMGQFAYSRLTSDMNAPQ